MGFNGVQSFGLQGSGGSGGGGGGGALAVPIQFVATPGQSSYTNALLANTNVAVFVEGQFESTSEYTKVFASSTINWLVSIDNQRIDIIY